MTTASKNIEALCIVGGPRSGKTAALIERAAAWAEESPASRDAQPAFLFFCASPATVAETAARLAAQGLNGVVTTPFEYACRVLAHPQARTVTRRPARVLTPTEEAVFYEDLKTCGLKRGRLRELWAFLMCGLANLDDDDPGWVQTTEEQALLDLAEDILHFDGAVLAGEVANLAVKALREDARLRQAMGASVVLADDYLLMSRASQQMVNLLAFEKIVVAGDDAPALPACEPHPCPLGFYEFEQAHFPIQRVHLETPFSATKRCWKSANDPGQELALIAQTVSEALASGTPATRIAIVGTNPTWRTNLVRALRSVGIAANLLERHVPKMPGRELRPANERDYERTLAELAERPEDSVAWRQWLSFGDALGRSAAVLELRHAAAPQELTLPEALSLLDADALENLPASSPFAQSLLALYREAKMRSRDAQPAGTNDFAHISASARPELSKKATPGNAGGKTPASLVRAEKLDGAVSVGMPQDLFGHTFDIVIFGGFVNGFIPSRDMCDPGVVVGGARKREEQADRCAIALADSRATKQVFYTGFESCDLETAELLNLHIARIRLKHGVRICDIEPSSYLAELSL